MHCCQHQHMVFGVRMPYPVTSTYGYWGIPSSDLQQLAYAWVWIDSAKSIHREVEQRGGKCHIYRCDLTDREDVYEVAERVKAEVGTVDILINNAGIVSGSYFLDTPDSEILSQFVSINTFPLPN